MPTPPSEFRYPCENCGASLQFAPGQNMLVCPYCGHRQSISPGAARAPGRQASGGPWGDDALLRKILSLFEAEGFAVEGADDILGGETLPKGALGAVSPRADQLADLRKALHVAEKSGELDIGQGAVVCDGLVLAVEAQEGTDAMLARAAALARPGPGGVLVKLVKPGQDRRAETRASQRVAQDEARSEDHPEPHLAGDDDERDHGDLRCWHSCAVTADGSTVLARSY